MPTETESRANHTSGARPDVQATGRAPKAQRIPALDFTKGALVLIMVLYHWINYFIGPNWAYYKYLHFLTLSFIFITGFMVSNVYLSKYDVGDARLSKRLFTRGLKLIAVFLVLNLFRTVVAPLLGTGGLVRNPLDLTNIFTVFVSGNLPVTGGKLVSFTILVPISYLLMLSAALMIPYRRYRYTFHVVCLFLLLSILVLGLNAAQSSYLESITIGMLGVLTGFTPIEAVNHFVRHPYALAFAYVCYTVAITIWNVPFPLLILGVALNLIVIYLVGANGSEFGAIRSEVILLGKYSLFAYISQIAILQILNAGFHRFNIGFAVLVISLLTAFVLTIVSAEVVDRGRAKWAAVDKLYKVVFA